ncbi:DNA-3-methyladenine glycosylase 2 family protein [Subtercola lobariae]|uniref:DNA-3-methyladenine glycosylase 2 family protein n=1 Tax=Subtercola lobariae TaxID=1588641 RepID=UPI001E4F371F|nr:AlkA N-terminal domain-containing protein [Subtercola lobariae]
MTSSFDPVFDQRYRAMKAKDARFDGQFITGVHTTGIYCRPSCPARTPHPQNVSFYLTAAAAHEAGLRACKRCFPDAVPGSPEWNLRDDLSARAMRLIEDGVVDREGVEGLALRLGYTPRHLTRVLTAELGAGPQALARAHRAQSARVLLQSTELPVTQVVFASGFSSVRAFNDTIAAVYETSPTALREAARRAHRLAPQFVSESVAETAEGAGTPGGLVTVTLPARLPFDGAGVMAFLADRAIAGVEDVSEGVYRRGLRLPHGAATIAVDVRDDGVVCTARLQNLADLSTLAARVRRLFDLDADAQSIDEALSDCAELRESVERVPGIRLPGAMDAHEIVFRALIGQQISTKAARTVLGRLAAALGDPLELMAADAAAAGGGSSPGISSAQSAPDNMAGVGASPRQRGPGTTTGADGVGVTTLFPTAAQIAVGGREVLRGPKRRIDTIMRVAEALASGELVVDVGVSHAQLTADLTALPGIGDWTAGYVAMRVLGAPDVLLDGDLAIRAGAAALGLPSDRRELARFAEQLSPWRSYLGMHLWRANHRPE